MIVPPPVSTIPTHLDSDDWWALVGSAEHERLDFKLRPDGVADTVAAMAMTEGGLIAIGISDRRVIEGCTLAQKVHDSILEAGHSCGVDLDVREVVVDGSPIVVIEVPELRKRVVTTPSGRLMRRVGSHSVPLVGDAMVRFVMERAGHVAEDDVITDPRMLDEIDLDVVNRALAGGRRPAVDRAGLLRGLADLGVAEHAKDGGCRPTKAAAILFARDPRTWVGGASVKVVRRLGIGPGASATQLREEVSGPLPQVVTRVIDLIEAHTTRLETVIRTHREVLPEYPSVAIREAITNAVAHRDYGLSGTTVDVTIWDDRLEILSPGPLPGHITVDNIREQHYSRNRRVMHVLNLLRLVEEYGEGVDRMIHAMEERLMDTPRFTPSPSSFLVTMLNRSLLSPAEQLWFALLGHLDLTRDERRLLAIVRREGSTTPRRLRTLMPDTDVDSLVRTAVTKGLLWRTGARGGTRYILSLELAMRGGEVEVQAGDGDPPRTIAPLELRTRQRQLLVDEIANRGFLTATQAATLLPNENPQVARNLLSDLVRSGTLVTTGRTRGKKYLLRPR